MRICLVGLVFGALMGLVGCEQDNENAQPEPAADGAGDAAPASDAAITPPDAGDMAAPPIPDAAVVPPDAGPGPCDSACERFADCSIEECAGFEAADRMNLVAACAALCAANPAFATVIDGAGTCVTVVDFARDQGDPAYVAACGTPVPPLTPDGSECPYPCVGDEICNGGQCVRPDGTCETEYHCRLGQECQDGTCRTGQFAECRAAAECTGEGQDCRSFSQNPLDPGICIVACDSDEQCPVNESCNEAAGNVCYYEFCGNGTPNGRLYGECRVGPWSGTCYPLAEGNASPQGTTGLCLEANGSIPLGGACDAQAEGRSVEDQALQCAPGGLCFGDPDDPRQPGAALDGQGTCVALCDPRGPACGAGTACVDFSTLDDPSSGDFDETTYLGACLASDCDVFEDENSCGDGRACRPYGVNGSAGYCAEVGLAAAGEACLESEDCAGISICGNNGRLENACLPICDPTAESDCAEGESCFRQDGWRVGFCVPAGQ